MLSLARSRCSAATRAGGWTASAASARMQERLVRRATRRPVSSVAPGPDEASGESPYLYELYTVPNALSAMRIAAAPGIGWLVWEGHHDYAVVATVGLAFTDWLDGYIAKNYRMTSVVGKFLDPMADKALVAALAVPLALRGEVPAALAALVVARDAGLILGTRFALRSARDPSKPYDPRFFLFGGMDPRSIGIDASPSLVSKANTTLQFALLATALLRGCDVDVAAYPFAAPLLGDTALDALCAGVAATTLASGLDYLVNRGGMADAARPAAAPLSARRTAQTPAPRTTARPTLRRRPDAHGPLRSS